MAIQVSAVALGGGVLLYGPPGTGKTFLAQATSSEIDGEFIELSPAIVRGYPGEPERKIEEIFERLTQVPRAVLFIDEAEALLPRRESQTSTVMQRIVPTFLSQLSKLREYRLKPVLVIAATNSPWNIDTAFLRPGRLDCRFYVPPPNAPERVQILRQALARRDKSRVDRDAYAELDVLGAKLDGYTAADIELVVDEAAGEAFRKKTSISRELLHEAARRVPRSVSNEDLRRYVEWAGS